MDMNSQDGQTLNYRYKFNCRYTEEELLDGYKDRKALIRYKRAILGTILMVIGELIFTCLHLKSIYFKHFAWYKSYIFWLICALGFMLVFLRNHDKFMWNSMPERTYSPQISTYDLYLCETCLVVIYSITGVKKVINYEEIDIYEVNNYFLLEHEYLNGYYISKEKLGKDQADNVRKFLKDKSKIKNLQLPFIFRKFARMPIVAEIAIIVVMLGAIIFNVQANNKTPLIGDEVVCNNLGIIVEEGGHLLYGNANSLQLYKVNLTLKSYRLDDGEGKELNPFEFKLVDKDDNEYKWFNILEPNELRAGAVLDSEEKINRNMYFRVPMNVQPEYLVYTTYNEKSKEFTRKILLKEKNEEEDKE